MIKTSALSKRLTAVFIAVMLLGTAMPAGVAFAEGGKTYYVSAETGSDSNSGTSDKPFATISKAESVMKAGDTCIISGGVYREALTVDVSNTTFKAKTGDAVVVSGGTLVSTWSQTAENPKIWKTPISGTIYNGYTADGLIVFAGDEMCLEARWPDITEGRLDPNDKAHPLLQRGTYARLDSGTQTGTTITMTDSNLSVFSSTDLTGAHVWCASGLAYWSYMSEVLAHNTQTNTFTLKNVFDAKAYSPGATGEDDLYYITRHKSLLSCEGEWYVDEAADVLYYYTENAEGPKDVEVRQREYAIRVRNASNVTFDGISVRGALVAFEGTTSGCVFKNATLETLDYRLPTKGGQGDARGIVINGNNNTLASCEIKNMYGEGVTLPSTSTRNRVLNCHVHDINFEHTYSDGIYMQGREHLVSRNTVERTGRGTIGGRFRASVISYNDMSDASRLSKDSGIVYFNACDYENTEIHHNIMRDSCEGEGIQRGLYLDSLSRGMIIYNNLVYNMEPLDGSTGTDCRTIRLGENSIDCVFVNNTFINTKSISLNADASGLRFINNLFRGVEPANAPASIGEGIVDTNNLYNGDYWTDLQGKDFTLKAGSAAIDAGIYVPGVNDGFKGSAPDCGAFESGKTPWTAGCDLDSDYIDEPFKQNTIIPGRNLVKNSGFESLLENWETSGNPSTFANGSWEYFSSIAKDGGRTLELDGDEAVSQKITGLKPYTEYNLRSYVILGSKFHYPTEEHEVLSGSGLNNASPATIQSDATRVNYTDVQFDSEWNKMWICLNGVSATRTIDALIDGNEAEKITFTCNSQDRVMSTWHWVSADLPKAYSGTHDVEFRFDNGSSKSFKGVRFGGFFFDEVGGDESVEVVAMSDSGDSDSTTVAFSGDEGYTVSEAAMARLNYMPVQAVTVTTGAAGTVDVMITKNGHNLKGYVDCISLQENYDPDKGFKAAGVNLKSFDFLDSSGNQKNTITAGENYTIEGTLTNISGEATSASVYVKSCTSSGSVVATTTPATLSLTDGGEASFSIDVTAPGESGSYFTLVVECNNSGFEHVINDALLQNRYGTGVFVNSVQIKDDIGGEADILDDVVPGAFNLFEIEMENKYIWDIPMIGMLAVYDGNGMLKSVLTIQRTIAAKSVDNYCLGTILPDDADHVKVFTWNNNSDIKPIIEAYTFD